MTPYPFRRIPRALWDLLGSRTASLWVMGSWIALSAVWLAPFQFTGQPQATIDGIALDWWPFRIAWGALLATTLVCGITRLVKDTRRVLRPLPVGRPLPAAPAVSARGTLDDAAAALEAGGYLTVLADDRVLGVRRRWSLLGGALFHLGVPLLAGGLLLHAATFGAVDFKLIEGQSADLVTPDIDGGVGEWAGLASATASMTLVRVVPEFYSDVLLFERLDATVRDDRTGRTKDLSLASPLWLDPFTTASIQDFGYAPDVQLVDSKGAVREEVIGTMKVFPPGSQDRLRLPLNGYTVSMIVYPDHAFVDGKDVSKTFNLSNPKMLIGVEQDYPEGISRGRGLVSLGQEVEGAEFAVRVNELRRYGTFRVARSYGWPLAALAGLLMLGGLAARVLFPREEVVVWRHDGVLGLQGRVDGRPGDAGRDALLRGIATRITTASGATGASSQGGDSR